MAVTGSQPRMKHRVEYAALVAAAGLLRILPHRAALGLVWGVAALMHVVFGFRRAEARRRIRAVFGEALPEARVRSAAWASFRGLCFNAVDMVRLHYWTPERLRERFTFEGRMDVLDACRADGRGLVVAVPHAGNWELAGIAMQRTGYPFFFLARRQKNALTDAFLNRLRAAEGVPAVMNDPGLMRGVIRRLRAGEMLALLPDARARTPAFDIPFLGGRANLGGGPAVLARHTGSVLLPAIVERIGWTRFRVRFFDPIAPDPAADRDADARRMLTQLMATLETEIRARPDQYFWYNARWVLDPLAPAAPREAVS
jgi:Kdo2-lipid IVA lauroyltransferase/acyltransferase